MHLRVASRTLPRITARLLPAIVVATLFLPLHWSSAQNQPLSLAQIEALIKIPTPDNVVAQEIEKRGLDFVPGPATLESLRNLGAGPLTLAAIDNRVPWLAEAKRMIPEILQQVYRALNEGNPSSIRQLLAAKLTGDRQKLDTICKPFTYRAHYVEAIIELPGRQFEARTRALFQPFDERAYVLYFGVAGGNFILQEVSEDTKDWFAIQHATAEEIARKFIYAAKATREDVVKELVTPGVDISSLFVLQCRQQLQKIGDLGSTRSSLYNYKGLKTRVEVYDEIGGEPWHFIVENVDGAYKMVGYFSPHCGKKSFVDLQLEARTLKRFEPQATAPNPASANNPPVPSSTSVPSPGLPPGKWSGTIIQSGSGRVSTIITLVPSGNGVIEASSGNTRCVWSLSFKGKVGQKNVYAGRLIDGTNCSASGTADVELRKDGSLSFEWLSSGGGTSAAGILQHIAN